MPNWCSTQITITGAKDDVAAMSHHLDEAAKITKIKNSFGEGWLGNILSYLGYPDDEVIHGNTRCRGSIVDRWTDGDSIRIDTETAWGPMLDPFYLLIERYKLDLTLEYMAIEPGCEIYIRNYEDQDEDVLVDIWDQGSVPAPFSSWDYEFMSLDGLREALESVFGKHDKLATLVSKFREKYGEFGNIHRIEVVTD